MKYLLLVPLLFIFGCASQEVKYIDKIRTVEVEKPVWTPPEQLVNLPIVPRPDVASNQLTEEDKQDPDKVIKIMIQEIIQLRTYAEQLENNEKVVRESLE